MCLCYLLRFFHICWWHASTRLGVLIQIQTNIRINIRIKNIWIFKYLNIFVTLCSGSRSPCQICLRGSIKGCSGARGCPCGCPPSRAKLLPLAPLVSTPLYGCYNYLAREIIPSQQQYFLWLYFIMLLLIVLSQLQLKSTNPRKTFIEDKKEVSKKAVQTDRQPQTSVLYAQIR